MCTTCASPRRRRIIASNDGPPGAAGVLSGRGALDQLAARLAHAADEAADDSADSGLGFPDQRLPRHASIVLIGDFLAPLSEIEALIGRLAAVPVRGHLLQILDPAEADLPYEGRIRFRGLEQEGDTLVPRVEGIRGEYGRVLARQIAGLQSLCAAAGFSHALHRTDHPAEAALLGLYTTLAPR